MTLTEFLAGRLDEDEAAAKAATGHLSGRWHIDGDGNVQDEDTGGGGNAYVACGPYECGVDEADAAHILRHDPARVLREVEAGRKILGQCVHSLSYKRPVPAGKRGEWALASLVAEALALPYADHPDYDEAVRVLT